VPPVSQSSRRDAVNQRSFLTFSISPSGTSGFYSWVSLMLGALASQEINRTRKALSVRSLALQGRYSADLADLNSFFIPFLFWQSPGTDYAFFWHQL